MAEELVSNEVFKRHCVNLKLLDYNERGLEVGTYKDHFATRDIESFHDYIHAMYSDDQLDKFIRLVVVPDNTEELAAGELLRGRIARSLRMLHTRGCQLMEKATAADKIMDYEGSPPTTS